MRRPVRRGTWDYPAVARQVRRLFGPRGVAARFDVLAATDVDVNSDDEAYRKAKQRRGNGHRAAGAKKKGDKADGGLPGPRWR